MWPECPSSLTSPRIPAMLAATSLRAKGMVGTGCCMEWTWQFLGPCVGINALVQIKPHTATSNLQKMPAL